MVRPITEEQIAPADAVARKILKSTEASLMSSVTKIGAGGFGDIYKICLKKPITDQELEGSRWETVVHVRNVCPPLEILLTLLKQLKLMAQMQHAGILLQTLLHGII